eukprot:70742-Amphidinium_carterae.1
MEAPCAICVWIVLERTCATTAMILGPWEFSYVWKFPRCRMVDPWVPSDPSQAEPCRWTSSSP